MVGAGRLDMEGGVTQMSVSTNRASLCTMLKASSVGDRMHIGGIES